MEERIILAFKKAVSAGDLEECLTLLKNYSTFEAELCASFTKAKILALKRSAIFRMEEDEKSSLLLPLLDRSYVELKKGPAPLPFVLYYNLINSILVKHGFAGCGNMDLKIRENFLLSFAAGPDIDNSLPDTSAIFKGFKKVDKGSAKRPGQPFDIENSSTYWPSKSGLFQMNNSR